MKRELELASQGAAQVGFGLLPEVPVGGREVCLAWMVRRWFGFGFLIKSKPASVMRESIVEFLPEHLAAAVQLLNWVLAVCAAVLLALWLTPVGERRVRPAAVVLPRFSYRRRRDRCGGPAGVLLSADMPSRAPPLSPRRLLPQPPSS